MKVLLIRNAFKHDFGGAETYAYNLAVSLRKRNVDSLVITKLQPLIEKCRKDNIKVIRGPWNESQEWSRWYYLRYFYTTLWYMWIILRHRIDAVHPQGRDDFIFATTAGWLLRKPVIWSDHADLKWILDREQRPNRRLQAWTLHAARKAKCIISESKSEHEKVIKVAPELTNMQLIHNGVFVPADVSPVPHKSGGGLVVGTNARLVADKGIRELLAGFAASKLGKTGTLWIVGSENTDRQEFYDYATSLGIRDRVVFWGYVPNPNDYVASMDIFVHASYHEAFSLAVIEAGMLGRPTIATAVGGTPEIIDDSCGILIQPKDSEAIRKALDKLGDDPALRKKLGSAVQQKAHTYFDFDKIVKDKILPLYKKER